MSFLLKGLMLCVSLMGCSYSMKRADRGVMGVQGTQKQKIFIPLSDNLSSETGFESAITRAIREELVFLRSLEIVSDPDQADLFLLTTVRYFDRSREGLIRGSSSTQAAGGLKSGLPSAESFSIDIEVRAVLSSRESPSLRRVIWDRVFNEKQIYEASLRFQQDLGSSSLPMINRSREKIQYSIVAQRLASRIVDHVVQDF